MLQTEENEHTRRGRLAERGDSTAQYRGPPAPVEGAARGHALEPGSRPLLVHGWADRHPGPGAGRQPGACAGDGHGLQRGGGRGLPRCRRVGQGHRQPCRCGRGRRRPAHVQGRRHRRLGHPRPRRCREDQRTQPFHPHRHLRPAGSGEGGPGPHPAPRRGHGTAAGFVPGLLVPDALRRPGGFPVIWWPGGGADAEHRGAHRDRARKAARVGRWEWGAGIRS